MSYSSTDLHTQLRAELEKAGYTFHEEPEGWFWSLAPLDSETFDTEAQAEADAMCDYFRRADELKKSAAVVIGTWESGNLAAAVRELESSLDDMLPNLLDEYIAHTLEERS